MIVIWLKHPDVSCWNFSIENHRYLEERLPGVPVTVCRNKEEFISYLPEAETIVIWVFKQEWFKIAPKLKHIITPAAGKDYFHIIPPLNITLDYSSFHGPIIAETVIGMMLSHARGLANSFQLTLKEEWPRPEVSSIIRSFKNSNVTILGFGNIGKSIGKYAKKFGVTITGVKRTKEDPPDYFDNTDRLITIPNLNDVLPETDHLVIALPHTEETTDLINEERLNLLPAHSAVYNIGRGNAIDEDALENALRKGKIGAAYLDVFKEEPFPFYSSLRKCSNLFIIPHASAISPNYLTLFIDEFTGKYKSLH